MAGLPREPGQRRPETALDTHLGLPQDVRMAMPSRLIPQIMATTDFHEAFKLLDKEIRYVLTYLADATKVS